MWQSRIQPATPSSALTTIRSYLLPPTASMLFPPMLSASITRGVSILNFEIGHFRTSSTEHAQKHFDPVKIADYIPLMQKMREVIPTADGAQAGEPEKGLKLMVDVIRGEEVAQGENTPYWMAVGSDAVVISRLVAEERLKGLKEWGDLGKSTSFEGQK